MSDRDAKLKIGVDASEMGPAAEKVGKLGTEIKKLGDQGEGAAGDLNKTAGALEKVEAAETGVAGSSREAAAALDGVGAAAQESSQAAVSGASGAAAAVEGVTAAAKQETAALEATGAAAVDAGNDAAAAAEKVAAGEREAAAEAKRLAAEIDKAAAESREFADGVAQLERMTAEIRQSDLALEAQRTAIVAVVGETEKLLRSQIEAGASGKDNANAAGNALLSMKARLADVNAEIAEEIGALRQAGVTGTNTFDGLKSSALDVETTLGLAFKQMNAGFEQLTESARVTPRQIGFIGQAIEATKIAMVQAGEQGIAVTLEQLAQLEKLEAEYTQLTAVANRLTNASKDNAVRLKETGAQITGLGMGIAQLGSILGPTGAKVGFMIGNISQLGSVMENLKDSAAALNLNTISAGSSAVTMGGQFAAVAVVLAAAAAAGVKVANTNAQNAEVTENLWQATKKFTKDLGGDVRDTLSGYQHGLVSVANALDEQIFQLGELGTTQKQSEDAAKDLTHAMNEFAVSVFSGQSGVRLYNAAIRDGLPEEQARRLAVADSAAVMKFYEQSLRGGAEAQALWTRGLRESGGDTQKFIAFIAQHNAEMLRATSLTGRLTDARNADTKATAELRQVLDQLDSAWPEMEGNIAGMNAMADAVEEAAGKVKGLTKEERDRLQLIVDLLRQGTELTDEHKRLAAGLLGSARAGKEASGALNTLVRLHLSLTQATNGTTKSLAESFSTLRALTTAWDLNSQAIRTEIAATQAVLDSTDNLTAAQRRQHQTVLDGLKAMDAARAQSAAQESARVTTMVTMEDELNKRRDESSLAIKRLLTDMAALVPQSQLYGGVLRDLGGQLQAVLDSTNLLSIEDRKRLEVIVELAAKGHDLTDSHQAFAAAVIAAALAEEQATAAGVALAKVQSDLDRATGGSTARLQTSLEVLAILTRSWAENSVAIRRAVGDLEASINATDGLTEAQRNLYEKIIDGIKSIDDLTRSKKDLEEEQRKLLDIGMQMTQEQYKTYEANQKEIYSIQGRIEATKGQTAAQTEQLAANKNVTISQTELVKVIKDGQVSWTNIGTAQKDAADKTASVSTEAGKAASGGVKQLGDAATTTASQIKSVGTAIDDTASELSESSKEWVAEARKMAAIAAEFEPLKLVLREIEGGVDRVISKFGSMTKAVEDSAARTVRAAGYGTLVEPE